MDYKELLNMVKDETSKQATLKRFTPWTYELVVMTDKSIHYYEFDQQRDTVDTETWSRGKEQNTLSNRGHLTMEDRKGKKAFYSFLDSELSFRVKDQKDFNGGVK